MAIINPGGYMPLAILIAIKENPDKAYGRAIALSVAHLGKDEVPEAHVYQTLIRLRKRGVIKFVDAPNNSYRGRGVKPKYYGLTEKGEAAISALPHD